MAMVTPDRLILETAKYLTSDLDPERGFERFWRCLAKEVQFDWLAIKVLAPGPDFFVIRYSVGERIGNRSMNSVRQMAGSLTEHVVNTGRTLVRDDITKDPQFRADSELGAAGFRSGVAAPLKICGKVIGTLSLRSRTVGRYQESETRIVEQLADAIAPWVAGIQLQNYIERQQRKERLVERILHCKTVEELAESIVEPLGQLVDFHAGCIAIFEEPTDSLTTICQLAPSRAEESVAPGLLPDRAAAEAARSTGECQVQDPVGALPGSPDPGNAGGSSITVPLESHGEVKAVLVLHSKQIGVFTLEQQELLKDICRYLAPQLDLERISSSLEEKAIVDKLAKPLTSALELDQVYESFATGLRELVDFDRILVLLKADEGTAAVIRYCWGPNSSNFQRGNLIHLPPETAFSRVMATGQTIIGQDPETGPSRQFCLDNLAVGLRSKIRIPLISNDKVIGALGLHSSRDGAFGLREQHLLESLARQIAPAIENAELHFQLKRAFEEQTVIDEVARIVTSTLDIEQVYEDFAREAKKLVDFDRMAINVIDTEA